MGAFYLPAAYMDGRDNHLIRCQSVHHHADRGNIRHRIHSAHLMEMNLRDGYPVHMALRFCDQTKHRQDILPDPFRHGKRLHDMLNLVHTAVVMMCVTVLMHLLGFFFSVDAHGGVCPRNAAFFCRLPAHLHTGNPQPVQLSEHLLPLR